MVVLSSTGILLRGSIQYHRGMYQCDVHVLAVAGKCHPDTRRTVSADTIICLFVPNYRQYGISAHPFCTFRMGCKTSLAHGTVCNGNPKRQNLAFHSKLSISQQGPQPSSRAYSYSVSFLRLVVTGNSLAEELVLVAHLNRCGRGAGGTECY